MRRDESVEERIAGWKVWAEEWEEGFESFLLRMSIELDRVFLHLDDGSKGT